MTGAKIRRLPPDVVGQIAAGEVVERPAAAIKELVENSMDAGATAITVDIRDGGLTSMRVTDNGGGIAPEDLRMAFERHATSKISTAEDLFKLGTLGFRGEALASIAAISRVTMISRQRGSDTGMQAVNEGGLMQPVREAASAEGTQVTVKDLFYNAPVRRKFLRKPTGEAALVTELMMRLILSHPEVSFRYVSDGKQVYFSPGDGRQDTAVMSVYGLTTLRQLTRVDGHQGGLLLSGFVGVGDASRGNRSNQSFFINGRAMRSPLLSQAVEEACRQRVMIGRFPVCILYLEMPYDKVDVNVHPNKWEVRFADEQLVSDAVRDIVFDALNLGAAEAMPPPVFPEKPAAPGMPADITRSAPSADAPPAPPVSPPAPMRAMSPQREEPMIAPEVSVPAAEPQQVSAAAYVPELARVPVRMIGEAFRTFILFESGDTLILCDQHALHERLLFDRMLAAYESGGAAQMLLTPRAVTLSYREYGTFLEHQALLADAGFDAEDFGEQTVRLHSVPLSMGEPQAESAFRDALDDLATTGALSDRQHVERILMTACRQAVRSGEKLPDAALTALVVDMLEGNVTPTCPHGRPLMLSLTRAELDKRFGRIQP